MKSGKTGIPVQKPWGWFSSLPGIEKALNKTCQHGPQRHAKISGKEVAETAMYPPLLCRAFADALMEHKRQTLQRSLIAAASASDEAPEGASGASSSSQDPVARAPQVPEESPGHTTNADECPAEESEKSDGTWQPRHVMEKLRVIHANLGHPSSHVMVRMLKEARASEELIKLAEQFECPHCKKRGHANPHRTSQVQQAKQKWEIVSVDTFWWQSS